MPFLLTSAARTCTLASSDAAARAYIRRPISMCTTTFIHVHRGNRGCERYKCTCPSSSSVHVSRSTQGIDCRAKQAEASTIAIRTCTGLLNWRAIHVHRSRDSGVCIGVALLADMACATTLSLDDARRWTQRRIGGHLASNPLVVAVV